MKKIFTLFAVFAASIGIMNAQTTISWALTDASNQLGGVSSDDKITVQDVTHGNNLTVGAVKNYDLGHGTLFSPIESKEYTSPRTDGSQDLTFAFTVPDGYSFKPTSVAFFSAADGSGNVHLIDVIFKNGSVTEEVIKSLQPDKSSVSPFVTTQPVSYENDFEGAVELVMHLYGKPGGTNKGWTIGDLIISGELVDKSDTREHANISWNEESVTLKIRDSFTSPVLVNDENLPITYSSSNEELAKVSADGVISLEEGVIGTAIISATYDGDVEGAKYKTTVALTTINVETNVKDEYAWVEYEKVDKIELDDIYKPEKTSGNLAASVLMDNAVVKLETVYSAKYTSYGSDFLGYHFPATVQIGRAKAAPSEDNLTGTEESGSSPLVVTAKADMQLVMFYRRQGLEQSVTEVDNVDANEIIRTHHIGMSPKDGKSVYAVAQDDIHSILDHEFVLGETIGEADGNDYMNCASIWNLEAGKTYTLYAIQTTIAMQGIGYIETNKDPDRVDYKNHVVQYTENAVSMTDAEGYTLARTGSNKIGKGNSTDAKNTITVNNTGYAAFKMKGLTGTELTQVTYSITAPEGKTIAKATVYAFANSGADTEESYFTQVGNHTFAKGELPAITSTDNAAPVVFTVDHIMLNKMDMNLHTDQDKDISVVVEVEVIDAHHTPACPVLSMGEVTLEHGAEYDHDGKNAIEIAVAADDDHEIYYNFTAAPAPAAPAEVRRAEEDLHAGYTKVEDGVISVPQAGTLKVYSYNPAKNLKSAPVAVSFKAPIVTGIENVTVDAAAEVEYFNLQGIRVANPENGVFIRRQGNDVKKVVR